MRNKLIVAVVVALVGVGGWWYGSSTRSEAAGKGDPMLVHNVFFTLKDSTPENRKKLIELCNKYLTKHDGEAYYAAGSIVEDLKREVNDRDFDVCLTLVFKTRADHDKYQDAKRHLDFIEQGKPMWKKVRVFDSWTDK